MRSLLLLFLVISCAVLVINGQPSLDAYDDDKSTSKKSDRLARVSVDKNEVVRGGNLEDTIAHSKHNDDDDKHDEIFNKKDTKSGNNSQERSSKSEESAEETTKSRHPKIRTTTEGKSLPIDNDGDSDKESQSRSNEKKSRKNSAKSHSDDSTDDNGQTKFLTQWVFG